MTKFCSKKVQILKCKNEIRYCSILRRAMGKTSSIAEKQSQEDVSLLHLQAILECAAQEKCQKNRFFTLPDVSTKSTRWIDVKGCGEVNVFIRMT